MHVEGVSALVTGGASGLGAATALRLARKGATVVIADLQTELGEALATEIGGAFVDTDVTDETQVQTAVDTAAALAPLRVAVNCAGIAPPQRTLNRDGTPGELSHYELLIRVNLVGTFNATRLAAAAIAQTEPLEHGQRGVIINTASVAAFDGQIGQVAYSASKAGIAGMTLPLARDLAIVGIRVCSIAPGIMDTPLLAGLPEKARESLATQVLFPQRLGDPDEFAHLAYHIVENDYLNGVTIRMDGGIRMGPK